MKFKDFQAPVLFSSTLKALNLGEKNSSTFKDAWEPCTRIYMTSTFVINDVRLSCNKSWTAQQACKQYTLVDFQTTKEVKHLSSNYLFFYDRLSCKKVLKKLKINFHKIMEKVESGTKSINFLSFCLLST